jgi:hypothetical protein
MYVLKMNDRCSTNMAGELHLSDKLLASVSRVCLSSRKIGLSSWTYRGYSHELDLFAGLFYVVNYVIPRIDTGVIQLDYRCWNLKLRLILVLYF